MSWWWGVSLNWLVVCIVFFVPGGGWWLRFVRNSWILWFSLILVVSIFFLYVGFVKVPVCSFFIMWYFRFGCGGLVGFGSWFGGLIVWY